MNWMEWTSLVFQLATLVLWILLYKMEKKQKDYWYQAWKQQSKYVSKLQAEIVRQEMG